jgi:hypothetical protein
MSIPSITHTFFDFEIERFEPQSNPSPPGRGWPEGPGEGSGERLVYLVKILSIDGRRFTYEVHGDLTEDAVAYVKSMIDAVVFSDLTIERTPEGFDAREVTGRRLKKHS